MTILVQPVVAGLLSWWVFKETLTPLQLLGGAVVLAAIVLAQWSSSGRVGSGGPEGPTTAAKQKGAEAEAAAPSSWIVSET